MEKTKNYFLIIFGLTLSFILVNFLRIDSLENSSFFVEVANADAGGTPVEGATGTSEGGEGGSCGSGGCGSSASNGTGTSGSAPGEGGESTGGK